MSEGGWGEGKMKVRGDDGNGKARKRGLFPLPIVRIPRGGERTSSLLSLKASRYSHLLALQPFGTFSYCIHGYSTLLNS